MADSKIKKDKNKSDKGQEWYRSGWGLLVAFLFLPLFIIWYAWYESEWSKSVNIGVTVVAGFLVLISTVLVANTPTTPENTTNQEEQAAEDTAKNKQTVVVPRYEVVKTDFKRYDDEPSYSVVINNFQGDYSNARKYAKGVTVDLVSKHGKKISVMVFANQKAFETDQRRNDTENICDEACLESTKDAVATGLIAWYNGFLDTMTTDHDMAYFPAATTDHETVGQYAGTEEFIAEDYQPK